MRISPTDTHARVVAAPSGAVRFVTALAIAAALICSDGALANGEERGEARADDIVTRTVRADFDDVRFGVENAIRNGGYVIDYHARINDMLERTTADVGAGDSPYLQAETWQFCSALLSRAAMQADPANIGHCPYVVFAYETRATPGEVVVGFRTHADGDGTYEIDDDDAGDVARSAAPLAAVDAALLGIVDEAVR